MKLIVFSLLLIISISLYAQKKDTIIIRIDSLTNYNIIKLPFSKIIVADARFDKTKLGFIHRPMLFNSHKKRPVDFPDSLRYYLPKLIGTFSMLSDTTSDDLFVLIKKFRVAENFMTSVQKTSNTYFILNISASFYSHSNGFLNKLFSVDDIFMEYMDMNSDLKISIDYNSNQRAAILTRMICKVFNRGKWNSTAKNTVFTMKDADAAIEKRFTLPVYQKQAPAGLYSSFDEFKKASPSVTGIMIKYDDGKIQKVIDAQGKEILPDMYWGLSDGKKNYISIRNEFSELINCDHGFRVFSYRTHDEISGKAVFGDGTSGGFKSWGGGTKTNEYFDLDMDTGEIFTEEIFGKSKLKNILSSTSK